MTAIASNSTEILPAARNVFGNGDSLLLVVLILACLYLAARQRQRSLDALGNSVQKVVAHRSKKPDSMQKSSFVFPRTTHCPAPTVSNNAIAAMLMAIVVIQPNVLLMRPLTFFFMIERLLPINMIITSSGGATIPFNTAV